MSATVYFLARAYPALFIVPALNIPIVNGVMIRVGTRLVENVCINLPVYLYQKAKSVVHGGRSDIDGECLLVSVSQDPDFPDFETFDIL